ncbi:3-keto-disaccharide hydrolase [Membranihabitans maritimus]|uniref:3-keto-disaccharide hydrolase n=1 Tax=Membranihabitans maritimus TaxID=2904244 RepID=UPI001F428375|nr:DUF1080 domain-containing protein [Membranihabitans maritimus]
MKKAIFFLAFLLAFSMGTSFGQGDPKDTEVWEPEPQVINPGRSYATPPSDAIILFSENNLDKWTDKDGNDPSWQIKGNLFTVVPGTGPIQTKEKFEDFQLHIEWRSPLIIKGEGQGRGNSGIFLQGKYEVQVLDSYQNRTYSNGQAASIYKQHIPLVNAMQRTGEWNSYDIIYTAPKFGSDGSLEKPAYVTVLHNGVLVQNHSEIKGGTAFIGQPSYETHGPGPLVLQDHSNPVSFRNVWIRKL